GGGTQRLSRLIGAANALPLILQGTAMSPQAALKAGIVHEVVAADDLVPAAKRWIKAKGDPVQPWDKPDYKIPGGHPYSDEGNQTWLVGNALTRKGTYGNFPAQQFILSAIYEGLQVPFEMGLKIEAKYFAKILSHPASGNMVRSLFISQQALNKLVRR